MSMAVREVSQTRGASRPHSSQRARRWLQWTRFIRQAMVLMAGAFEDKMRLRIRRGDSTGSQSTIGWLPGLSTNVYYAVSYDLINRATRAGSTAQHEIRRGYSS